MPLVICMHGRGADANDLADLAPMLDGDDGYRFLFPNAPKAFEPYPGMAFGWTWFEGWPPRQESIAAARAMLLEFIDRAVEKYPTPPGKLVISGFSQGGLMSIDAGYRTKQKVGAIVIMSGAAFEAGLPDLAAGKNIPVLIAHGSDDEVIPVLAARRTRRLFEEHGIEPEYYEFPMGHQVAMEEIEVIRQFLVKCLG